MAAKVNKGFVGQLSVQCLPNLLLQTGYALNKSNSKSVLIGLESHNGSSYRPVVKFSGGSNSRYITFNIEDWQAFVNSADNISAYLRNAYTYYQDYNQVSLLQLPRHTLRFTSAYEYRAVAIAERDSLAPHLTQPLDHTPPSKKIKFEKKKSSSSSNVVVIQLVTFQGLMQLRECIDKELEWLEGVSLSANKAMNLTLNCLADALKKEDEQTRGETFVNINNFVRYYTGKKSDVENIIRSELDDGEISKHVLNRLLLEFFAFGILAYGPSLNGMVSTQ